MAELPKIAFGTAKGKRRRPGKQVRATCYFNFQGAEHPDANLLAAFVEKSLTEKERTQVLNHLAQCADCREVAAFTLPEDDAVAESLRARERRSWSPWPILRWGAMVAVLGSAGHCRGLASRKCGGGRNQFRAKCTPPLLPRRGPGRVSRSPWPLRWVRDRSRPSCPLDKLRRRRAFNQAQKLPQRKRKGRSEDLQMKEH